MSSAAYQTNAKPRGRRGSYSESSEKQSCSRASSSASMRLSKTLSRHLDEVAVPRNSRPSSPAVHNHRQRPLDLRSSDPSVNTGGHSPDLRTRSKTHSMPPVSSSEKDVVPPSPVAAFPVRSSEPNTSDRSSVLGGAKLDAYARHQESMNTLPGLTRNTRSFKSLASMQPTVTEEVEERADETLLPTPQPSVSSPTVLPQTTPSKAPDMQPHDVPMPESPVPSKPSPRVLASSDPRASESSLDELLLAAPSPKAPIPFIPQPVISSNEESGPVTIVQSPGPVLENSQIYEQVPCQARTPLASPPQSPMLHQYMGSPPLQPVPYMHPFPYPPPLIPNATYSPGFYPAQFAPAPMPNFPAETIPRSGSAGAEDERTRLLEKVSNVLPDINRLLHHYQETQGLLSEKENLVKQAETHHVEEITKLQVELTVTKEEFEKIIGELATENVRLKGELSEQTERFSRVEENNPSLAETRSELEKLKLKYKELETEHGQAKSAVDQLTTEKGILKAEAEQYKKELQENRLQLEESCQRQIKANEEAHTKASAEQKTSLSKIQLDLAGMITKHTIQKKDLDFVRSMLSEKEHTLALKTKELETALQAHKEELESRNHEDQEKDSRHKQEIALWSQKMAEGVVRREEMIHKVRTSLEFQIEKEKESAELRIASLTERFTDQEKKLTTSLETAKAENESLKNEITKEQGAHNALKSLHLQEKEAHKALQSRHDTAIKHHVRLTDAMLVLKNKQAEWHRESDKMDRILQSLGQLGSSKVNGKGDEYFVSAFDQLASSVEEISKHFFHDSFGGRITTRSEFQISGLPDMTGQSEAARGLRCLVIQNQIFEILQRRIFEPFLFTTAFDGYDTYGVDYTLSMISGMIRAKSVNRERIWRSTTMRAIYGSAYGRKAAVVAAGMISKEIMERIQSLANPTICTFLFRAVRLVVKAAVQLWRRARLEWDLIHSMLPSTPDWERGSDIMLWVRPHVVRDRMGSLDAKEANNERACVYLQGTGIREDSPLVMARREELLAERRG